LALAGAFASLGLTTQAYATTTITQISYDAGNHVASVTDPRGLVTTYAYDGLGQLWGQASPDTGTTTYNYDAYGRRSSMTRADNSQTTYGYDALGRVTSVSAGGQVQSFTYDACTNGVGRMCSAADASGVTSYSYSPEGWLTGRGFSIGGTAYSLGYSYNSLGQVASVVYPDGNQATYSYTRGVVSAVSLSVGGATVSGASGITYQPMNSAMTGWTSSNGIINTLNYDSDGRLINVEAGNVQSLALTYDLTNRVVGITDNIDPSMTQNFGYDDQSRLVSIYSNADQETLQYDANGNRVSVARNGLSTFYNIDANSNKLLSTSGAANATFGYSANGNVIAVNGVATYEYSPFNHLTGSSGVSSYINPEGWRVRKGGSTLTYFATNPDGGIESEYVNGGWVDYVFLNGRLIARIASGQVDSVHEDQTERPEVVTNGAGATVWRSRNFAFDRTVTNDQIGGLNLGFPGQYYDNESGSWNNGLRNYVASQGRFLESDPLGLEGGINTYQYAGGNPITNIDPSGLTTLVIVGGATSGNPFGHVAMAFTGRGIYSYGTGTEFGSSVTMYVTSQSLNRSNTLYEINTTPEQEQAMINYIMNQYGPHAKSKYSIIKNHDCASMVSGALASVGIGINTLMNQANVFGGTYPMLPFTSEQMAASSFGVSTYFLPQNGEVPVGALVQYNPSGH
ncbi:MAG: RHS repeat protein, partial [Halothiobacillus sp.]|nr:RHS repeat protein [Halothiobacillus sp.]